MPHSTATSARRQAQTDHLEWSFLKVEHIAVVAWVLAFVLPVLTLCAVPTTAGAVVSRLMVSNIDGVSGERDIISLTAHDVAQQFTTGDHAGGYTLDLLKLVLGQNPTTSFTVDIYTDASGAPGTKLGTLTPRWNRVHSGRKMFLASDEGIDLDAETSYFLVLDSQGGGSTSFKTSIPGATDAELYGMPEWTIAGTFLTRTASATSGSWTTVTDRFVRFKLTGRSRGNAEPQFSKPTYTFSIDENRAGDTTPIQIGTVTATDADANDTITYSLSLGPIVKKSTIFKVDAATGAFYYIGPGENFESLISQRRRLMVAASDGIDETRSMVILTINDVKESVNLLTIYHDPEHSPEAVSRYKTAVQLLDAAERPYMVRRVTGTKQVQDLAKLARTVMPRFFRGDPTDNLWGPPEPKVNNGGLRWLRSVLEEPLREEPEEASTATFTIYHDADNTAAVSRYDQAVQALTDAGVSYTTRHADSGTASSLAGIAYSVMPRFFLGDPTAKFWVSQPRTNNGGLRWLRDTLNALPTLSVADARVTEGAGATVDFTVTLNKAATTTVTVDYTTADGTATAGSDYTATSGTLTFATGVTSTSVAVPVLDDDHDEGEETLTLTLSNPSGSRLADAEATGTIVNTDPLQRAWLARFGRTVATHVTDAVTDRLRRNAAQDSHVTVGGHQLVLGKSREGETQTGTSMAGLLHNWAQDDETINLRQLLAGSSFRLNLNAAGAGSGSALTAWGRFAGTTFDGQDDGRAVNGDVFTGTVGVDREWDRLLVGVAVAHSRGDGVFNDSQLENTLTSLHPYVRYAVTDRLDVWGLAGYGWGEMDLELANNETLETDTDLLMGAFGGRGILLKAAENGGVELATRTDAMLTRTSADAVTGLAESDAEAHRIRLILEGSRGFTWADGRSLTPTVELGVRHDWGDAETGFGFEVGGRVQYVNPRLGLTVDGAVRGLLAHEDTDYKEWGASGTIRVDPGIGGQGLALTVAPAWGATASGVDSLWTQQSAAGFVPGDGGRQAQGRLNAEVGYGLASPFGTGLVTPYAGTVLAGGSNQMIRVGTTMQLTGPTTGALTLRLEGTHEDANGAQPVNQGLRLQTDWQF